MQHDSLGATASTSVGATLKQSGRSRGRRPGPKDEAEAASKKIAPDGATAAVPLCVDLDGTLISSDLLAESGFAFAKRHVSAAPRLVSALRSGGKAGVKAVIASEVDLRVDLLPYREDVLEWLRGERAAGRRLVLASASDEKYVHQVAEHLGLFDEVFASNGTINLIGTAKADLLVAKYGERGFDYVGDSAADLAVWRHCRRAILVAVSDSLEATVRGECTVERAFPRPIWVAAALRCMRPHQWLKNLLIVVPFLLAHFSAAGGWSGVIAAFASFSLAASSVYILNDLLDIEADRLHPRKRRRPFAAGRLDPFHGVGLAAALLAAALLLGLLAGPAFLAVLAGYIVLTTAYSLWLKRIELVDVVVLALLYTVRIIAGAAASDAPLSFWLLAFSMFFFLSLALVKRFTEMHDARAAGRAKAAGRNWQSDDLEALMSMGVSSGQVSVLICALYINSAEVTRLYSQPMVLWLICPLLLHWVNRIWLLARRGQMHDDPVVFAAKDRTSATIGALTLIIGWLAA